LQVGVAEESADDVGHVLQPAQRADDLGFEFVGVLDAGAADAVVAATSSGCWPDSTASIARSRISSNVL
jgi:hypothetical protein